MGKFKQQDVKKVISIDFKNTDVLWKDLFTDLHQAKEIQKKAYFERRYLKIFLVEVEGLISSYGKFLEIRGVEKEMRKFQIVKTKFFNFQFQRCHSLYLQHVEEHKIPLRSDLKKTYNEEYNNIKDLLIQIFAAVNKNLLELIVEMTERDVEKNFDDEQDPIMKQIKKARWRMNKVE